MCGRAKGVGVYVGFLKGYYVILVLSDDMFGDIQAEMTIEVDDFEVCTHWRGFYSGGWGV